LALFVGTVKAVLGTIGGTIGFIILGHAVDAVIDTIMGAIERKELENATPKE